MSFVVRIFMYEASDRQSGRCHLAAKAWDLATISDLSVKRLMWLPRLNERATRLLAEPFSLV